jgi:hypothetical protein
MRQTYLPDHFPQSKSDQEDRLKRKTKDYEISSKSLKTLESPSEATSNQKSEFQILSNETLTLLTSLGVDAQSSKSAEEVLNSINPREKYQDLLDPVQSLHLPYQFKRLSTMQEYLDNMINNARIRHHRTFFNNLKQAIDSTYSVSLEVEHLQRINFLIPNFYHLSWTVENGEENLVIDLPEKCNYSQFLLHNRAASLKAELLKLVKKAHQDHLENNGLKFDAEKAKTWHSTFDPHSIPELSLAPLPEKSLENPTVAKACLGKQLRAVRLIKLCKMMGETFQTLRTSSVFMKSLVKKVKKMKGRKEESKLIENDVNEISEIFNGWLGIYNTASGLVVRVNKSFGFSIKAAGAKIRQKYGLN